MKAIRGLQRGVKQEPKLNKAEQLEEMSRKIESMDKELKNTQMAGRVAQMLLQQFMQQLQNMGQDLGKAFGTINEMQYKVLAMQSVGNFDMDAMAKKADELRINDFVEASDAEDKAGNFTVAETVQDDSTVIITSTTADGAGIFRSRIKLAESGVPALIKGLTGSGVGTKVECKLGDVDHVVELLAVRNPPPAAPVEQSANVVTTVGEPVVNADGSESRTYVREPKVETVH